MGDFNSWLLPGDKHPIQELTSHSQAFNEWTSAFGLRDTANYNIEWPSHFTFFSKSSPRLSASRLDYIFMGPEFPFLTFPAPPKNLHLIDHKLVTCLFKKEGSLLRDSNQIKKGRRLLTYSSKTNSICLAINDSWVGSRSDPLTRWAQIKAAALKAGCSQGARRAIATRARLARANRILQHLKFHMPNPPTPKWFKAWQKAEDELAEIEAFYKRFDRLRANAHFTNSAEGPSQWLEN